MSIRGRHSPCGGGSGSLKLRRPSGRRGARPSRVSGGRTATRGDGRPRGDRRKTLGLPLSIVKRMLPAPRAVGACPSLRIRRPDVCSADARRHLPRSGQRSPPVHRSLGPLRSGNEAPPSQPRPHGPTRFPRVAKLEVFPQRVDPVSALQENHRSMARPTERTIL